MRPSACVICHQQPSDTNPVQTLRGAYQAQGDGQAVLHLCDACLSRRETRSWSLARPDGVRLARALAARRAAPDQRFTYFAGEDRRLHLVHLRPDWAQAHAT